MAKVTQCDRCDAQGVRLTQVGRANVGYNSNWIEDYELCADCLIAWREWIRTKPDGAKAPDGRNLWQRLFRPNA